MNVSQVTFRIDKSGMVSLKFLRLEKSSGNIEGDFACVDAIESACPLPPPYPPSESQYIEKMRFYEKDTNKLDTTATDSYFAANPDAMHKVVVIHAIPLDVRRRYPGSFDRSELSAVENLRGLKQSLLKWKSALKNGACAASDIIENSAVRDMLSYWPEFFNAHTTATREELNVACVQFDTKFSALFYQENE